MSSSQEASPASSAGTSGPSGTKGRPKGSQGESLIKRSVEVLGLDRVSGMQRRKKTTKGSEDSESKAATRREQVLEAQRTHRMRTKIYIKELESEVLRLRKSEATAKAQVEMLEQRNAALLHRLQAHGIERPREQSISPWEPSLASLEIGTGTAQSGYLPSNTYPAGPGMKAEASTGRPGAQYLQSPELHSPPVQLLPGSGDLSVVPSAFTDQGRLPGVSQQIDPATPFHFEDSQAELDFILTLERPCMAHLHESHFSPHANPFDAQTFFTPGSRAVGHTEDEPEAVFSGHVLTTSMPLWRELKENGPTNSSPELARKELRNLLSTSYRLGLRNEIAPVQILELLRMRAVRRSITVQHLRNLAVELSQHLRCYGFGAVFDEDVVKTLMLKHC